MELSLPPLAPTYPRYPLPLAAPRELLVVAPLDALDPRVLLHPRAVPDPLVPPRVPLSPPPVPLRLLLSLGQRTGRSLPSVPGQWKAVSTLKPLQARLHISLPPIVLKRP